MHLGEEICRRRGIAQSYGEEPLNGVQQRGLSGVVLMNDYGGTKGRGAGSIRLLVLVRRLREGHQHGWSPADRQLTEAAGSGTTDGQVSMLQQPWNLIAEAAFHQQWVLQLPVS